MKKKKIIYLAMLILFLSLLALPSFAVENTDSNSDVENKKIVKSDIVVNNDNYYELKEKIYQQKDVYKPKTYNSDSETLSLKEYVIQESRKGITEIDISSYAIPYEDLESVLIPMFEYEELFYVDTMKYTVTYPDYQNNPDYGIGASVIFTYRMTAEEIEESWKKIDSVVQDYLSGIKTEWNYLEKIIYTNNYICQNCEYDYGLNSTSHTMDAALINKSAVCDGYSKAFKYLLKQIGVESVLATSNEMNHAWNMVKLDENYYHIDVTWIDGDTGVGKTNYEYFLVSDEAFKNDRTQSHYSWVADYEATSTKYDISPEWSNTSNYLIYKDNYWYYLNDALQNTNSIELNKVNFRIETPSKTNETISTEYVFWSPGLTTDDTSLYFTTKYAIWKMNFDGTNITKYYELSDTTKVMYSVEYKDSKFYYDTTDIIVEGNQELTDTSTRKTNTYNPNGESSPTEIFEFTLNDEQTGYILSKCLDNTIETVEIPATYNNLPVVEIGYSVFRDFKNLKTVVLPDGLKTIGVAAFYDCDLLKNINIPNTATDIGGLAFFECENIESIVLPEGTVDIGEATFEGCTSLKSITIPETVTAIGDYAFYGCTSLNNVVLPKNLQKLGLYIRPNETQSGLIGAAFANCKSLTSITIPDGITIIPYNTFAGCENLVEVKLPSNLTEIHDAAFARTAIKNIVLPDTVTKIENSCFYHNYQLESITLSKNLTEIGHSNFVNCTSLKEIKIPNKITEIGSSNFENCTSLKELIIPNKITELEGSLVKGCTSLEKIVIPPSVTSILPYYFYEYDESGVITSSGYKDMLDELPNVVIYGYEGSYAETYAKDHNYKFEKIIDYTTKDTEDVTVGDEEDAKTVTIMPVVKGTDIEEFLTVENFPIIGIYTVEVYDDENGTNLKESGKLGSRNVIKITDENGNVLEEYTVIVPGDITGNGYSRMYDAFQILKDTIIPGKTLDAIDIKIRDYNGDGNVRMYDAFQFLKIAILGK